MTEFPIQIKKYMAYDPHTFEPRKNFHLVYNAKDAYDYTAAGGSVKDALRAAFERVMTLEEYETKVEYVHKL